MTSDEKEVTMDTTAEIKPKGRRRRRTRKAVETESTMVEKDSEPMKAEGPKDSKSAPVKIVLAPAKKVPKVLLIPKGVEKPKPVVRKTFRAKKIHMVIDNSAKTQKRRRNVLLEIDSMTDEQVRAAAVASKIYTKEAAAKLPLPLLKSLMKDFRMMKGLLV